MNSSTSPPQPPSTSRKRKITGNGTACNGNGYVSSAGADTKRRPSNYCDQLDSDSNNNNNNTSCAQQQQLLLLSTPLTLSVLLSIRSIGCPLTHFFSTAQASKLLPVCRTFRDLFAHRVWRLQTDQFFTWATPDVRDAAVFNYGHCVRTLDMSYSSSHHSFDEIARSSVGDVDSGVVCIAKCFPNVLHLKLPVDERGLVQLLPQLGRTLSKLKKLTLLINDIHRGDDFSAAVGWINNGEQSGHVRWVEWRVADCDVIFWDVMADITKRIDSSMLHRHRISTVLWADGTADQSLAVAPYVVGLPDHITYIECATFHHRTFFGGLPTSETTPQTLPQAPHPPLSTHCVFSSLRVMVIKVCCCDPIRYDFSNFTPDRFPVLEDFTLNKWMGMPCCPMSAHLSSACAVSVIFQQQWRTIRYLKLLGTVFAHELDDILSQVPNVEKLAIGAWRALDKIVGFLNLAHIANKLPLLTSLTLAAPVTTVSSGAATTVTTSSAAATANMMSNSTSVSTNGSNPQPPSKALPILLSSVTSVLHPFQKLQELDLYSCRQLSCATISFIVTAPRLRSLTLRNCTFYGASASTKDYGYSMLSTSLSYGHRTSSDLLELTLYTAMTDDQMPANMLAAILNRCPRMKRLGLVGYPEEYKVKIRNDHAYIDVY